MNLIDCAKKTKFNKSTLGGCVIEKRDNFLLILKETKAKKVSYQPTK